MAVGVLYSSKSNSLKLGTQQFVIRGRICPSYTFRVGYASAINIVVQAANNGFNMKIAKRRFFGQFDHH